MMSKVFITITIGAGLLLLPALLTLVCHWHWQENQLTSLNYFFYLCTQTVTRPWGMITSLLLAGCLYCFRDCRAGHPILLVLVMLIGVAGGQAMKSLLKPHFAEPRPYVVGIMKELRQPAEFFYQQSKAQRQQIIRHAAASWPKIPPWQLAHWQNETGFSFPSGHSLFVASWVLLFYGLVNVKRYWPVLIVVTLWAWAVMWSRLLLGMHWPQDLIASVVLAWFISVFLLILYRRHCENRSQNNFFQ